MRFHVANEEVKCVVIRLFLLIVLATAKKKYKEEKFEK